MGILRTYFAISVLLGHIGVSGGIDPMYAVQGFYIISGFYMSLILNEKYCTPDYNLLFYKKRFMRLAPTYWLLSSLCLLLAICYYLQGTTNNLLFDFKDFPANASPFTYLYIIVSNIIIWGQDLALFLSISPDTGNIVWSTFSYEEQYPLIRYMLMPVSWSVSLEFSFYIIAPFILRKNNRWVHVLFVLSLLSNVLANYYGLNRGNWRFRFFPSTLIFFLTGYYAYRLYVFMENHKYKKEYANIVLLCMIVLLTIILNLDIPYLYRVSFLLTVGLLLIPYIFYSFKINRYDRYIGELSYPLYLIHPIFIGINEIIGINSNVFIIVGSLLGSIICYKFFIAQLERRRALM